MTMRLTIRNEDHQRIASITVEDYQMGKVSPVQISTKDIAAGESCEIWIHASRRAVITENTEASIPKP